MPEYTENARIPKGTLNERDWHTPIRDAMDRIDGSAGVGPLAVTTTETPSTALTVRVAEGRFVRPGGQVGSSAGTASLAVADDATTYVWLDAAGAVQSGVAMPTSEHTPLAEVTAEDGAVATVVDYRVMAGGVHSLPPAGSAQTAVDVSAISALTFSDPPEPEECEALRDAVAAVATLANALRTAMVNSGAIKGSS